jgi:hypothetical protein
MLFVYDMSMRIFDDIFSNEDRNFETNKLTLGLAALFHDFNHSGGILTDDQNVRIAEINFTGFCRLYDIQLSDIFQNKVSEIILATEFPHKPNEDTLVQIIRDADTIGPFFGDWLQIVMDLCDEMGKTLIEYLPWEEKFIKETKFNTYFAGEICRKNECRVLNQVNQLYRLIQNNNSVPQN